MYFPYCGSILITAINIFSKKDNYVLSTVLTRFFKDHITQLLIWQQLLVISMKRKGEEWREVPQEKIVKNIEDS